MDAEEELVKCRGGTRTLTLYRDRLIVSEAGWRAAKFHELPIKCIRAVIVERKSIIPFASIIVLAAIATVVIKYDVLGFLIDLRTQTSWLSTVALAVCISCAIPALSRAIFVNVTVSWDGGPSPLRVRFVPAYLGRRLARRFREVSVGS